MAFNKIFDRERRDNGPRERDFKRRDGGKRSFGRDSRGGDRERPQMHEAICSDCGKRCEVPFKPTNDKPIYCSQCFTNHGGASRSDSREDRGGRDRSRGDRPMFDATCDTCGKRFQLPFRPTGEKPVYCNDCFDKEGGSTSSISRSVSAPTNQYKEQFEALNSKLDKILKILNPVVAVKEEKKEVIVEKKKEAVVEKKVVAAKKVVAPKKEIAKKVKKVVVKKPIAKKKGKK